MAQLAQCMNSYSQSITIIDNPKGAIGGRDTSDKMIKSLKIFPNPVNEKLSLVIELKQQNQVTVEIYHVQTKRRELSVTLTNNTHYETDFKVDHLPTGLYVVVVKAGDEIKSMKLIKQ